MASESEGGIESPHPFHPRVGSFFVHKIKFDEVCDMINNFH